MKVAFRIECPHCLWGMEWKDNYINQGWIALICNHCKKESFTKIDIPIINVKSQIEPPEEPIAGQFKKSNGVDL